MLYWTPVENPVKNPDQTSGSQGLIKRLHHAGFIVLQLIIVRLKWYFHMTVTKFMKIYEGERFH